MVLFLNLSCFFCVPVVCFSVYFFCNSFFFLDDPRKNVENIVFGCPHQFSYFGVVFFTLFYFLAQKFLNSFGAFVFALYFVIFCCVAFCLGIFAWVWIGDASTTWSSSRTCLRFGVVILPVSTCRSRTIRFRGRH